jgi:hypothetical protein
MHFYILDYKLIFLLQRNGGVRSVTEVFEVAMKTSNVTM